MLSILTTILFIIGFNSMTQSDDQINKLIDKKWHLVNIEIASQSFPSSESDKENYTIFYSDHTLKTIDRKTPITGKWKYDLTSKTITLYSDDSEEKTVMKILSLTDEEYVFETTTSEAMTMKIHMSLLKEN